MGLPAPVIDMILDEHSRRPIQGHACFIGKQTTYATIRSLRYFEMKYGIQPLADFQIELDKQTRASLGDHSSLDLITDRCLMNFIGIKKFSAIDVSDYEGADIVCDLSHSLPDSLYGKFDFIFNGSCLDNIFNPAEALRNISRMLKPNGRLVMIEHGSMANGPYTVFSPGWFFDYFCCNKYSDCRIYHGLFENNTDLHFGPWPLYLYNWPANPNGTSPIVHHSKHIMYLVVAQKGTDSTDDVLPIQFTYRDPSYENAIFRPQGLRMLNEAKPSFGVVGRETYLSSQPFIDCKYLGDGIVF